MTTARLNELDNILGDAQHAHRGLETDAVLDAMMESFGYDEDQRRQTYAAAPPVFQTLIDSHGFSRVKLALRDAIAKLCADESPREELVLKLNTLSAIQQLFAGKAIAFTAVVSEEGFAIGVAIAGEPGYWPIPSHLASSPDWEEMHRACDALNAHMGLSVDAAARIVTSSMAAQNRKDRTR